MKRLILPLIFILALVIYFFSKNGPPELSIAPTPEVAEVSDIAIEHDNQNIQVVDFIVSDISKLKLIENYEEKLGSDEVYRNNGCKYLINGGFYDTKGIPIGLLVIEGNRISNSQTNDTLNGFIVITEGNDVVISPDSSGIDVKYAIQTGPLLIKNGLVQKLNLVRDQYARRMIAIVDSENRLHFIALFNSSSYLQGPYLSTTANALKSLEGILNIQIVDAINLDGGAASAVITPDIKLTEISNVGSFFCLL